MSSHQHDSADVAVFVDVDNIFLACKEEGLLFLPGKILEKAAGLGRVVVARAYADWSLRSLNEAKTLLRDEAFDLIQLSGDSKGKNSADIQLAIDAIELALTNRPPSIFLIISGDRDFVPLALKLRQHRIHVVGIATPSSLSTKFKNACATYVGYNSLVPAIKPAKPTKPDSAPAKTPVAKAKVVTQPATPAKPKATSTASAKQTEEAKKQEAARVQARALLSKAVSQLLLTGATATGSTVMHALKRLDSEFSPKRNGGYSRLISLATDAEQHGVVSIHRNSGADFSLTLTDAGRELATKV